jgi:hypothetical protein
MRSIEIARLEHIEVSSLGEENFRWSIDLYDKRKKDNEKILKSIERSLSSKLSKNHHSSISYDVLSELDGRNELLGLCLFMHYEESSDMDIDSVIDFSIKHVENILKSIKSATEIEGVDLSRVKIETGSREESVIDGSNLIIPKSVLNVVNDIISNISQNGKYTYTIGKNKIDLNIRKPDRSILEDDKNNLVRAEILGVIEKSSTAHIRVDEGSIKQYKYYGALRDELLTAQLKRMKIDLTVRLNYLHEKGVKVERGGTIVSCDFIDNSNSALF